MRMLEWKRYAVGCCRHPECMVQRGRPATAAVFPSIVSRIDHPDRGIFLFDTGYASHFLDATQTLPERLYRAVTPVRLDAGDALVDQLARENVHPHDVAGIVLSHLHGDHVAGVRDFPDAPVWCSKAAVRDLRGRGRLSALRVGLLPALLGDGFDARCRWIEDADMVALPSWLTPFVAGHDVLGDGSLLAVALPGHAPGHVGLAFEDAGGPVFVIGDAAWTSRALRDGAPPPSITTGWLGDTRRYRETFAMLCALAAREPSVRMVPSHCSEWSPDGR